MKCQIVFWFLWHSVACRFIIPFQNKHDRSESRETIIDLTDVICKGGIESFVPSGNKRIYTTELLHDWTPEEIFEFPHTVEILMDVASKHRCAEIVTFASSVQVYSRQPPLKSSDKLFAEYIQLVDTYIAPRSKFEINISQCCRERLMEYTKRSKFGELPGSDCLQLFSGAYKEVYWTQWRANKHKTYAYTIFSYPQVLQIIQMNLLVPFHAHPRLKEFDKEHRETIGLERSLTETGLVHFRDTDTQRSFFPL